MIFSGNRYRSLVRDNKFSANFDLSFSNATGRSEIGFSGDSKRFLFSFISGKMFDNEGRYFSSYLPNAKFSINTDFSGAAYDYSVNSSKVLFSGLKSDFYVDRFFINTTGVNIDATISVLGNKPSFSLVLNPTFVTGSPITGYFTSNSQSGVRIFTGEFADGSNLYFQSLPTGFIRAGASGQAVLRQVVTGLGYFYTQASFDTTAGLYEQNIEVSGIQKSFLNYIFAIQGSDNLNDVSIVQLASGVQKIGQATLDYGYNTNDATLAPTSLPIDISLSYYSGNTGYYGQVSSVTLVSGGYGYLSAPTIIFSGGYNQNIALGFNASTDQFRRVNPANFSSGVAFEFVSGDPISFYRISGKSLPSPLEENKTYYVFDTYGTGNPFFTISTGVSGIKLDITNTGSGVFSFYNPSKIASAQAVLGSSSTDYASVVSVQMNSYGSGYTSTPTILFSGGTGIVNNNIPILASGLANMSMYTKSFSGFFNLYTGYAGNVGNVSNLGNVIPSNLLDYRSSSYFSGNKYTKTGVSIPDEALLSVVVSYTPSFDRDIMVSKLVMSGANQNVIEKYITGAK
jgi:hypothetical protein